LKFVMRTLTDQDAQNILLGYNAMKQYRDMISNGHDHRVASMKQNFLKRILDQGYNLMAMGFRGFLDFQKKEEVNDEKRRKIYMRMSNEALRFLGQALRMLRVHCKDEIKRQKRLNKKQRGVARRMLDQSVRLMGMAWVNLYDNFQVRHEAAKDKIKWIINCLRNNDLMFVQMAYGALKERKLMLDGVGLSGGEHKKNMLIRRLRDTGFNMQVMGIHALLEFLKSEREAEASVAKGERACAKNVHE
jgi:hypothetical protein